MKRLGIVKHLFGGMLIARSSKQIPAIGSAVVTNTMKRIGTVREIFGPVSHPYISVKIYKKVSDSEVNKLENKNLYIL